MVIETWRCRSCGGKRVLLSLQSLEGASAAAQWAGDRVSNTAKRREVGGRCGRQRGRPRAACVPAAGRRKSDQMTGARQPTAARLRQRVVSTRHRRAPVPGPPIAPPLHHSTGASSKRAGDYVTTTGSIDKQQPHRLPLREDVVFVVSKSLQEKITGRDALLRLASPRLIPEKRTRLWTPRSWCTASPRPAR